VGKIFICLLATKFTFHVDLPGTSVSAMILIIVVNTRRGEDTLVVNKNAKRIMDSWVKDLPLLTDQPWQLGPLQNRLQYTPFDLWCFINCRQSVLLPNPYPSLLPQAGHLQVMDRLFLPKREKIKVFLFDHE